MTQERTYTLIERDHYGAVVNTITGLVRARAELVADTLRSGDAYTDKIKPWTCEIVREPSREEQIAAVVDEWLTDAEALTRTDHIVACLRHVADVLEPLGDKTIPRTGLKVELHLFAHAADKAVRMAALDELAAVFGRKGEMSEAGHYHTGYVHGGGLRIVTIAEPEPEPEPIISDETIRQAAERVEEILAELNALTQRPDEAAVDWWDWISDQPEFDREATAAAPTGELHLVDGTVLVWQATPATWKRQVQS